MRNVPVLLLTGLALYSSAYSYNGFELNSNPRNQLVEKLILIMYEMNKEKLDSQIIRNEQRKNTWQKLKINSTFYLVYLWWYFNCLNVGFWRLKKKDKKTWRPRSSVFVTVNITVTAHMVKPFKKNVHFRVDTEFLSWCVFNSKITPKMEYIDADVQIKQEAGATNSKMLVKLFE